MPCREVKQREEYKDTNEPKSIYVRRGERDHKKGKISLFFPLRQRLHFSTTNSSREEEKNFNSENMSNPVVFFDMEIGGQPAGRIEMTVRIRIVSVLFYAKCFLLLLAKALMFVVFSLR